MQLHGHASKNGATHPCTKQHGVKRERMPFTTINENRDCSSGAVTKRNQAACRDRLKLMARRLPDDGESRNKASTCIVKVTHLVQCQQGALGSPVCCAPARSAASARSPWLRYENECDPRSCWYRGWQLQTHWRASCWDSVPGRYSSAASSAQSCADLPWIGAIFPAIQQES